MSQIIGFGGHTETHIDELGDLRTVWVPERTVLAVPYNYLVPGYRNRVVNTLRLWSAESPDEFNLEIFNAGDYETAVTEQVRASNLSKVLYPEDSTPQGKELRLSQQFFFSAASLRDFLTQALPPGPTCTTCPSGWCSSSTTRTRSSQYRSSCGSCWTSMPSGGTRRGGSPPRPSPTRATP